DGVLGTDPAARGAAALAVALVLDQDAVERVHAIDAEQAEVDALHAIGAAAVVDDRIPAAIGGLQQLLRIKRGWYEFRRCGSVGHIQAKLYECRLRLLALLRLAPLAPLLGNAADFFHIRFVIFEIAKMETVDMAVRHVHRADALGRLRLALLLIVVEVVGWRLKLRFAEAPFDAVAIEQPKGGARVEPAQDY